MFKNFFTRKKVIILAIILLLAVFLYWFFMKTNRGSSLALYAFAGWRAPLDIRFRCGGETDKLVAEKFAQPLKFDKKTTNELRGFWYYSYYRGCLFKNGYDFSGKAVPKSSVENTQAGAVYKNPYAGFQFSTPKSAVLKTSNNLDVNFDDRILVSELEQNNIKITVRVFLRNADYLSLLDIFQKPEGILVKAGKIAGGEINQTKNKNNVETLRLVQENGTTNLFAITRDKKIIYIFGENLPLLESIRDSLYFY